jgi:hypothetical protein
MIEPEDKARHDHAERMRNAWRGEAQPGPEQPKTRTDGTSESEEERAKLENAEWQKSRSRNDGAAVAPPQRPATLVAVEPDSEGPAGESESEKARRENAAWQRGRSRTDATPTKGEMRFGDSRIYTWDEINFVRRRFSLGRLAHTQAVTENRVHSGGCELMKEIELQWKPARLEGGRQLLIGDRLSLLLIFLSRHQRVAPRPPIGRQRRCRVGGALPRPCSAKGRECWTSIR